MVSGPLAAMDPVIELRGTGATGTLICGKSPFRAAWRRGREIHLGCVHGTGWVKSFLGQVESIWARGQPFARCVLAVWMVQRPLDD